MDRKKFVIVTAGGSGIRMHSKVPKQFLEIGGKPILRHTVERFLEYDPAIGVVISLPASSKQFWKDYCASTGFISRYTMVSGGITRFHSVRNALEYIPDGALVAVHDGVRPFVTPDFLARMFEAAETCEGVIPVLPVVDSLRELDRSGVSVPVDRSSYVSVQTPQIFRSEMLKSAYCNAYSTSFTDDASVFEAAGFKVSLAEGLRGNFKITSPEDLAIAEVVVRRRADSVQDRISADSCR